MEAVAQYAGEKHSDRPKCVSDVLGIYGRIINDILPAHERQKLIPLIPYLVGTKGDGKDKQRTWVVIDWLVRTYCAEWCVTAERDSFAQSLTELRPIRPDTVELAAGVVGNSLASANSMWYQLMQNGYELNRSVNRDIDLNYAFSSWEATRLADSASRPMLRPAKSVITYYFSELSVAGDIASSADDLTTLIARIWSLETLHDWWPTVRHISPHETASVVAGSLHPALEKSYQMGIALFRDMIMVVSE